MVASSATATGWPSARPASASLHHCSRISPASASRATSRTRAISRLNAYRERSAFRCSAGANRVLRKRSLSAARTSPSQWANASCMGLYTVRLRRPVELSRPGGGCPLFTRPFLRFHARRSDAEIDQDRRGDEDRGIGADQHDTEDHGCHETVDGMPAEEKQRQQRER